MNFVLRKAEARDVSGMFRLVKELAEFERAPHEVINTEEVLLRDGFEENSVYRAFVAVEESSKEIVGMALYYTAYSTWKGKLLFLDDLVVTERCRRFGLGRKLINEFLKASKEEGVNQIRWQVLDWNTPAIGFYKTLGVEMDEEWITVKMGKEQIEKYVSKL
ncbi:MAG: GNAT family N-acetyltransferase [Bacteroidetes bacterium]|nr:GNAT family N-acetyltransferase [Bacteroidota bacterium]